jgi:predicted permease
LAHYGACYRAGAGAGLKMRLASVLVRIRSSVFRENLHREIEDEIEFHLELETRKYMLSGIPEDEARRRAKIALGGKTQIVEECGEQRGAPFLENVIRDCRYALRVFRRSPAFALAIVFTVAVAIGANTTVFAFCKAMLLAALPVPNPQQLYLVSIGYPGLRFPPYPYFSFPDLQRMQKASTGTAVLTGFTESVDIHVQDDSGTTSTIKGQLVAGNFFSVLRAPPLAGRVLSERDNDAGTDAVAVLSYRFWKERFGSDYTVIGKRLLIQRKPVTIIAVMPKGFDGVEPGVRPDIWMPLSVQAAIGYGGYASMNGIDVNKPWLLQDVSWLHVLARSPHDRNGTRLHAELTQCVKAAVAAQLPHVSDARERMIMLHAKVGLTSAAGGLPRLRTQFSLPLRILFALVAVLLFSGCVNIINLLFARARAQEHEAAIRVSLGSSRIHLIANRVTETLLLVAIGGLLSLPLAIWGSKVILHWLVISRDLQIEIAPDWLMLGFTLAVTLITGLAVALLSALRIAHPAVSGGLGQRTQISATTNRRAARLSSILVGGQLALSVASLVIAGLLTHTLLNYEHLDIGMDRQHVLNVAIDPSAAGYNNATKLNTLYRELTTAIDRIPGVVSSSVAGCGLMDNGCATMVATVRGTAKKSNESLVERNYVGAGYFSTVGTSLLRGRGITEQDTLHTLPIGVVNLEFERQFINGQSALGRIVRVEDREVQIVGLVGDARSDNIHRGALPYLYLPVEQAPGGWNVSHLEVRTTGHPEAIANSVRTTILGINRAIPVAEITTLSDETNRGLASELLVGRLAGLFSALTLVIAAIGLYGILAYEVSLRRPEFAVRLALGATKHAIIQIVLLRASLIWITGCGVGIVLSISAARFISSLLFETGTLDIWIYAGSVFALLAVSSIAVCLPAWRAGSIDPASILRSE